MCIHESTAAGTECNEWWSVDMHNNSIKNVVLFEYCLVLLEFRLPLES